MVEAFQEVVGHVFSSEGSYGSERVEITLLANKSVYRGEYLCIKHPAEDKPVFIQVETASLRRPSASYEEKLLRDGDVVQDPEKIVGKAFCWQVGYEDSGLIRPLLSPIPPLTPVYRPSPEALSQFISPDGPGVSIGTIYPTDVRLRLSLKILFRQGALVVGGVGTGKSTLLMSLMLKILKTVRNAHILLIDWDGEFRSKVLEENARQHGGYQRITSSTRLARKEKSLSPASWYNSFRTRAGLSGSAREARTLYAITKKLEEDGVNSIEWSQQGLEKILSIVEADDVRKRLEEIGRNIFKHASEENGVDIVETVRTNALVHVDFSDASNWDEIINRSREILETCYLQARADPTFGVAVFIDEVHNFAPQSPHEGAASREAYDMMIPVMKLIATTGPRNGVPLFLATQRLSEVDKFISTQMGQNIFAFRVEDVDLERLRSIMGSDIAYSARLLPRGYCIYKGHALKIQRPVICVVDKEADVASVGRDLLTRWQSQ
ncbi:hypothetical protein CSUB_C0957 [Candidatus Caldarchaeum subterraneum]|uniref:Helicase HerA central domain-containing protein n=1 Tax=Caldiarchaeum subterraneum TaxID=311458 RepID=E6N6Q5_CALS0|nr:hypothetical protein HGMM_F17C01C02 [Candidatus Caldarchaeum subterraneum]BAJ48010.1 hypothetical protein HGMM_F28E01C11 [Candidatus Caldarchaeum subterraneum]BAJ50810.1 hypothetical protein CSUB_C0957 [Candidatus Caldarchaeum subterraneum]